MKKGKKSIALFIVILFLFVYLLGNNSNQFISSLQQLESDPNISTNYLFKDKVYNFTLEDIYDDADPYKIYTDAYFQAEYYNTSIPDWQLKKNETADSGVDNNEVQLGNPANINMVKGTSDYADNMKTLDALLTLFSSTSISALNKAPTQWTDFSFTKGSGGQTGELETNNGVNYVRIDAGTTVVSNQYLGYKVPSADVLTSWNEGSAVPHYNKLDEAKGDMNGDGLYIRETSPSAYDKWTFGTGLTIPSGCYVSRLDVYFYCNMQAGCYMTIRVQSNCFSTSYITPPEGGGYAWKGVAKTGLNLNQASLNALYIQVDPYRLDIPYGWVGIETVYVDVYYSGTQYLFDYEMTWSVDPSYFVKTFNYDYQTSSAVKCDLDIYNNAGAGSWVELRTATTTAWQTGSQTLEGTDYVSDSNVVKVRFQTESSTADFDMYLDQISFTYYTSPSELEFTILTPFLKYNKDLMSIHVECHQKTSVSQLINFKIWNYDTTTYDTISSETETTTVTKREFNSITPSKYVSGSGIKLYWDGTKDGDTFNFYIDYLIIRITYKMDLWHTTSFDLLGTWRYRWEIHGSLYYSSYVTFEVIGLANFEAISESDYITRWILQNATLTPTVNFTDDISGSNWYLDGVASGTFIKTQSESSNYLMDNYSATSTFYYSGTYFSTLGEGIAPSGICWDGTAFWVSDSSQNKVFKYTSGGIYTGVWFSVSECTAAIDLTWDGTYFWVLDFSGDYVYKYYVNGTYTGVSFYVGTQDLSPTGIVWDGTNFCVMGLVHYKVYKYTSAGVYTGTSFTANQDSYYSCITWDGTYYWLAGTTTDKAYRFTSAGSYTGYNFNIASQDGSPTGICWDGTNLWVSGSTNKKVFKYIPYYEISKKYQGSGYVYMQTNTNELIALKSTVYGTNYTLASGDYFEVDFQTSSDSLITLILYKDGVINKTLTLSQAGNTNFNRHTVQIPATETLEFDQLKISSTFEDKDYVKVFDIKTYKYTLTGDYADFYLGSRRSKSIYLTPDTYNLRIFENDILKVNVNITISTTGVTQYIYEPIGTIQCRITLFSLEGEYLQFEDYHIQLNRSLNGEYNQFWLVDTLFYADEETYCYINVYDRFDASVGNFSKLASSYIDLDLEVYRLQIKSLLAKKTTLDINSTHVYELLSGEYLSFMLVKDWYQIGYYDEQNTYNQFTIYLDENKAYELNTTYYQVYFSLFNFDGLGIEPSLFRFYINGLRKDFGFNTLKQDTNNIKVLDYFNASLFNQNINLRQYTEYNIFVEVYTLIINNNYSYSIRIEIERNSIEISQIIPAQSGLSYRFLPEVEYILRTYYINGTLIEEREIVLDSNNKVVSFGFFEMEIPVYPPSVISDFTLIFTSAFILLFMFVLAMWGYWRSKRMVIKAPKKEQDKWYQQNRRTKNSFDNRLK